MNTYEVHTPSAPPSDQLEKTFKVDAVHWMAALRMGMGQLEQQGSPIQSILADIQSDESLHVTEARSGRVFRVRLLSEEESNLGHLTSVTYHKPMNPAALAASVLSASSSVSALPSVGLPYRTTGSPLAQMEVGRDEVPESEGHDQRTVFNIIQLTQSIVPVLPGSIGRKEFPAAGSEEMDVFAGAFERTAQVPPGASIEDTLHFFLDLAMKEIPVETGSIFRADEASGNLRFVVGRGSQSKEELESSSKVPGNKNVVGFCLRESVSVALPNITRDSHFHPGVAETEGIQATSVLCSPISKDGRVFGCMELINRRKSHQFQKFEIGVLLYLAQRIAAYWQA